MLSFYAYLSYFGTQAVSTLMMVQTQDKHRIFFIVIIQLQYAFLQQVQKFSGNLIILLKVYNFPNNFFEYSTSVLYTK